jgi:hypothetical protein
VLLHEAQDRIEKEKAAGNRNPCGRGIHLSWALQSAQGCRKKRGKMVLDAAWEAQERRVIARHWLCTRSGNRAGFLPL